MRALILPSLALFAVSATCRVRQASCPPGTWLDEGVRPSGIYECAPIPPARWRRGPRGGWVDTSPDPSWAIEGAVYCTGGEVPVVARRLAVRGAR